MKSIIKPVLYISALAWLFAACKKDLPVVTLDTSSATEPALTATESSLILLEARQNNTAVIFNWTKPEYNFPASFVHTLQFAKAGTNFASPVNESIGTELKKIYTEKAFNTLMLSLGIKAGQEGDIQVRVRSVMNDSVAPLYSNSHAMTVTPYSLEQFLYVPGDHQGWSPSTASIIRSPEKNNKYEGYVYIGSGNRKFKFTDEPDWANGIFGDENASGTSGKIVSPGNDFLVASFGYWKINADFVAKTWTNVKTDWAITGSATPNGWPDPANVAGTMDQDMTWDATNKVMTITLNLTAGAMKFRANDAWDINLGDNDANGSLEYGGSDISIASAGNYTITLDLKGGGGKYTYTVKKN
jgi:starch-binding outer membrane protein SusE/F